MITSLKNLHCYLADTSNTSNNINIQTAKTYWLFDSVRKSIRFINDGFSLIIFTRSRWAGGCIMTCAGELCRSVNVVGNSVWMHAGHNCTRRPLSRSICSHSGCRCCSSRGMNNCRRTRTLILALAQNGHGLGLGLQHRTRVLVQDESWWTLSIIVIRNNLVRLQPHSA